MITRPTICIADIVEASRSAWKRGVYDADVADHMQDAQTAERKYEETSQFRDGSRGRA
jgi:hypothetical protein